MSKGKDKQGKSSKKEPGMTLKEKRAAKKAKRREKSRSSGDL